MRVRDAWQLARGGNAIMAGLGALAGLWLGFDGPLPAGAWLAPVAAAAITAFGNILNDLGDVEVDRVAHPERPLPRGTVSRGQAKALAVAFLVVGLACAALAGLAPLAFAVAVVALLLLYERALKASGLAGNIIVALLTAATFLFGWTAAGFHAAAFGRVASLAAMAFFANLARELIKDVQDMVGDAGRRTLPMRVGSRPTILLSTVLCVLAAAASWPLVTLFWAYLQAPAYLVLAADAMVLAAPFLAWREVRVGQIALKIGMATALLAVGVDALLEFFFATALG